MKENDTPSTKHVSNELATALERLHEKNLTSKESKSIKIERNTRYLYTHVYHGLTKPYNLSPTEALLTATVCSLSSLKGYAYASQKYYADTLNVTPTTINTAYKKLKKKGVLEKCGKNANGTTGWRVSAEVHDQISYLRKMIDRMKQQNKT